MSETTPENGEWVLHPETKTKVWKGPFRRVSDVGNARVHYLFDKPSVVENATLDDGDVIPRVETFSAVEPDIWRRPDGNGGYLIGTISIGEDGVVFNDDPALDTAMKNVADDDLVSKLHRDLMHDQSFLDRMQNDAFADAVYASFCNREWRRSDGERHFISWRTSGAMVASLRKRGESYIDWYPFTENPSDDLLREVENHYASLGWTELTEAEAIADHEEAETLVSRIEERPAGDSRQTDRTYHPVDIDTRQDLYARSYRCWESGRATADEFAWIRDRVIVDYSIAATSKP